MKRYSLGVDLRPLVVLLVALGLVAVTAGSCASAADVASDNTSTAADNFEVERLIVGINTETGEVLFSVQGRCSITRDGDLVVVCKDGPNEYKKHFFGLSPQTTYVSTQLEPIDVSVYHTRIILRPETIVPGFDLSVGEQ